MNATTEKAVTVVEKSSEECAAHNAANNDSIRLGLEFPWTPSDGVVAQEKRQAELAAKGAKFQSDAKAIFNSLGKAENFRGDSSSWRAEISECYAGIKKETSNYSLSHTGWRMEIAPSSFSYGRDSGKKWMKIGEGTTLCLTLKQQEKAKAIFAEVLALKNQKKSAANEAKAKQERNKKFCETSALAGRLGVSYYDSGLSVAEDGSVTWKYDTFTEAQWNQILDLRDAQNAEMKALKDSFKA